MLATPVLDKLAYRISFSSRKDLTAIPDIDFGGVAQEAKPVILAGFGRMGHRIGYILDLMKLPYVAIDADSSLVNRERAEGKTVYFGDARRPEVLRAAGAADTPFVIVSVDDLEAAERVVSSLHSAFPGIPVFARGHDLGKCRELKNLGAYFTVSETLEASAELAHAALLHMGAEDSEIEVALEQFRKDYYERINV
jgi:voltage-gated potassium channel Kch